MHRDVAEHAAAGQERRVDHELERDHAQPERRLLSGGRPLLDHHRVQRGGGEEPRHEAGVLDGVPGPPAAEAERLVRPVAAHHDADSKHAAARQRPRERGPHPLRVAALPEPGHGEGEWHHQQREAEEERRRVNDHPRVLEEVVEALALGRHEAGHLQHGRLGKLLGEAHERADADRQRPQLQADDHRERGTPGRARRRTSRARRRSCGGQGRSRRAPCASSTTGSVRRRRRLS